MHFHAELYVPLDVQDIDAFVEGAIAPHREDENTDGGFWDWYQIGGRWTGEHSPDYRPEDDPSNIEICNLCHGTGFRTDGVGAALRLQTPSYTCNGCGSCDHKTGEWAHGPQGPGKCVKWPTDWARYDGDVMSISDVPDDLRCVTLIVNGAVFHTDEWVKDQFVKTAFDGLVKPKLKELGIATGRLITIDYHS